MLHSDYSSTAEVCGSLLLLSHCMRACTYVYAIDKGRRGSTPCDQFCLVDSATMFLNTNSPSHLMYITEDVQVKAMGGQGGKLYHQKSFVNISHAVFNSLTL